MKKIRRQIAVLLTLCVAAALFPLATAADSRSGFIDLKAEVSSASPGDTLTLTGDAEVNVGYLSDPWILTKSITIDGQGHTVIVRTTGILLDADVTFKNVKLNLVSTDGRNAIIANGHSLTLEHVTAGARSINLFCGTLLPAEYEDFIQVPAPGRGGTITVRGNTSLQGDTVFGTANIYAGSLCMGSFDKDSGPAGDGPANIFQGDAVIRIEGSADSSAVGTIYAGGAQQRIPLGAESGKVTLPNPEAYTVSGSVTVTGAAIPDVDGAGSGETNVVYQGTGNQTLRLFRNITSLAVESGHLALRNRSSLRGAQSLSIAAGAKLELAPMTGLSNLDVQQFSGNGYLILNKNQTWVLDGTAAGHTTVVIGALRPSGDTFVSTDVPLTGHTYIQAPNSGSDHFVLLPPATTPGMTLVRDSGGNWSVPAGSSGEEEKLVADFQFLQDTLSVSAGEEAEFPMTAAYANGNYAFLDGIPLTVYVGETWLRPHDDDDYYSYADVLYDYTAYVADNTLCITTSQTGSHTVTVTVPAEYTAEGKNLTRTVTLTIAGEATAEVTGISVSSTAHKTGYAVGESLSVAGLTIQVSYTDGTTRQIPVTADMVSGFDSSRATESQVLTVSYAGKTTSYAVRITAIQKPDGGGSSGGGGSFGGDETTTVNPDGSITAVKTDRNTGTVTETTRRPDGSKTVVETQRDGSVTTTDTAADGSTVTVTVHPDGPVETSIERADGFTASLRAHRNGTQAEVRLPSGSAQENAGGTAVALPIPALPGKSAELSIHTGSSSPVRVAIPVEGSTATTVAYFVDQDGTERILKKAAVVQGTITLSVPDGAVVRLRDGSRHFDDIESHWAGDAIRFVTARELFLGKSDSAFRPDASMTRAMLMVVLARLDGVEAAGASAYAEGMSWAVNHGISDGRDPGKSVTREQFITMLYRYAGSPSTANLESSFPDSAQVSGYARDAVRWAVESGILGGFEDGSVRPQNRATRAQAAVILARYVEYLNRQ